MYKYVCNICCKNIKIGTTKCPSGMKCIKHGVVCSVQFLHQLKSINHFYKIDQQGSVLKTLYEVRKSIAKDAYNILSSTENYKPIL